MVGGEAGIVVVAVVVGGAGAVNAGGVGLDGVGIGAPRGAIGAPAPSGVAVAR